MQRKHMSAPETSGNGQKKEPDNVAANNSEVSILSPKCTDVRRKWRTQPSREQWNNKLRVIGSLTNSTGEPGVLKIRMIA